jgi:amino acid transporter
MDRWFSEMSEAVTRAPGRRAGAGEADKLPSGSLGLFDTTSSTLANIAPALSVFLTIPAIVMAMGTMAPWAFVIAMIAILATGNSLIEFTRRMPSAGGFIS